MPSSAESDPLGPKPARNESLDVETVGLLRQVSTATLATQLFRRGFRSAFLFGVKPLSRQGAAFVGDAFTMRCIPAREDLDIADSFRDREHPQRKAIETIGRGQVLVIDSRGDGRGASAGAILVTRLRQRGASAIVTDGSFRDSPAISRMGFPAYCASVSANLSLVQHHAVDFDLPIGCAGTAVFPGDVVVGDEEGVICIPRHLADEVAREAAHQEHLESYLMSRIEEGAALPGTYPPEAETLAAYELWRKEGRGDS